MLSKWIAILYDTPGNGRKTHNDDHWAGLPSILASGRVVSAGAVLRDPTTPGGEPEIAGSCIILRADNRADVHAFLSQDVFYQRGVWDLQRAVIHPYVQAKL